MVVRFARNTERGLYVHSTVSPFVWTVMAARHLGRI